MENEEQNITEVWAIIRRSNVCIMESKNKRWERETWIEGNIWKFNSKHFFNSEERQQLTYARSSVNYEQKKEQKFKENISHITVIVLKTKDKMINTTTLASGLLTRRHTQKWYL